MAEKPLVSIIIPCYNGEKVVGRALQAVAEQTYSPIELVFVNDGSTDKTADIFMSYEPLLEEKGLSVKYIYQDNCGLGAAIDTGIRNLTGEFFCWPDADDYLEPTSVEERVKIFLRDDAVGVVTSDVSIRRCEDLEICIGHELDREPEESGRTLFERMLRSESIFCPGCHMIRTEYFRKAVSEPGIYPARRGQNWQLLLPMYYNYPRALLKKPLYNYIISPGSMSHGDDSYEKRLFRFIEHETIIKETLKRMVMPDSEREKYTDYTTEIYARHKMILASEYRKRNDAKENYRILCSLKKRTMKDTLYYYDMYFGVIPRIRKLRK